jgi:hypothetical protein
MDWKDIGKIVAPIAPVAGSILGGLLPIPGGSLIGEKFGQLIAGAFGVAPTPQAVSDAIANSKEETVRANITAATEQARIQIEGFVALEQAHLRAVEAGLHETGATMRAENEQRHWFYTGWRPMIGWVFMLFAFSFGVMLTIAAAWAAVKQDGKALQILSDAWPIFLSYFGVLGLMVGVYIPSRSFEKKALTDTSIKQVAAPAKPVLPAGSTVKPASPAPPVYRRDPPP